MYVERDYIDFSGHNRRINPPPCACRESRVGLWIDRVALVSLAVVCVLGVMGWLN